MPRQDVPYGGAICRLKERIAEIWDKLGEKLHTINGVPGDGDGNVKIVSGSSAVVINNDPTQNEIAVSLDTSQLPAASVSSVNGQTGAVALDAGDIPTVGGDVQSDIQDLANDISGNTAAINAEVLARQQGDASLQTNINTVSASLPAAAAAAVAADPTVAQLVTDLGNKVDLTDVSTVETPDTIAKRNGSGRLIAADPASGATDKTLVTANWVSQTGAGRPNNLIHDGGNEDVNGNKAYFGLQAHPLQTHDYYISGQYCRMLQFSGRIQIFFQMYTYKGTGLGVIDTTTSASEEKGGITLFDPSGWWSGGTNEFFILYNTTTSKYEVWYHTSTAVSILVQSVRTYGTARAWGYYDSLGNTQSADPRSDTTTYPGAPIVIPVQVV